jgi:hypothetical protein
VEKVEQVERCASPCDCGWISVVALGATSGSVRPFDSTRRDATRVSDDHDVELETALDELELDLAGDG